MKNLLKPAFLSLCLLAPAASFAQDDRATRLSVASEYVAAAMADMDMPRIIEQMWRPLVAQIESSTGKQLTDDQLDQIDTLYQETFADKFRTIMNDQDEIMADLLNLEEITALKDFYETPAGRSVMQKLPDILAKQQPQIIGMVQETMPLIMPKLQAIVAGN